MKLQFRVCSLVAIILPALAISDCAAQPTSRWASSNSGSWSNQFNWTDGVPDANRVALIDRSNSPSVSVFSTGASANDLRLLSGKLFVRDSADLMVFDRTDVSAESFPSTREALLEVEGDFSTRLLVVGGDVHSKNMFRVDDGNVDITGSAFIGSSSASSRNGRFEIIQGNVDVDVDFSLASGGATTGVLHMHAGTLDVAGDIFIGRFGEGDAQISGSVSSASGWVGERDGAEGTITLTGSQASWQNTESLYVGDYGTGELRIMQGASVTNTTAFIGNNSPGHGTVAIDGLGSTWNSTSLKVGFYGNGALNITGGGTVTSLASVIGDSGSASGAVSVAGAGSTWEASFLTTGESSSTAASLDIADGGGVNVPYAGFSINAATNTDVQVAGNNSVLAVSGRIDVGFLGTATVDVSAGGQVTSEAVTIGDSSGSTGTVAVRGSGSVWQTSGSLNSALIAREGTGRLDVLDGGQFRAVDVKVAASSDAVGELNVSGTGSTLVTSNELSVGRSIGSDGKLTVTQDGYVNVNGDLTIGWFTFSTGKVTIDGGRVDASNVYVGGRPAGNGGTGRLELTSTGIDDSQLNVAGTLQVLTDGTVDIQGGSLVADTIDHTLGGTFTMTGGSVTAIQFNGDLAQDGGTLDFAVTSDTSYSVDGNYQLNQGAARFEFGDLLVDGTVAADLLTVTGDLTLGTDAELHLSFTTDELSNAAESFYELIDVNGTRTGIFNALEEGTVIASASGSEFAITYVGGDGNDIGLIRTEVGLTGDFDLDGDVDGGDFLAWQRDPSVGDSADWQTNYGETLPPAVASSTAVPEPTTGMTAIVSICLCLTRGRRVASL